VRHAAVLRPRGLLREAFEPNQRMLWAKPNSTWAWQLTPLDEGRTRLIVHLKQHYDGRDPGQALLAAFLMPRAWFDNLQAPNKWWVTFEASSHRASFERPAGYTALLTDVLAETTPQDLPRFGFIRSIDHATSTLVVDEAEWLTGSAAVAAAVEDGEAPPGTTDLPNGFYLRNRDADMVTVELAADVTITMPPLYSVSGMEQVPLDLATFTRLWTDEARAEHRYFPDAPYHLTYTDGVVTAITEQYVP
jgi:hypothetical protein